MGNPTAETAAITHGAGKISFFTSFPILFTRCHVLSKPSIHFIIPDFTKISNDWEKISLINKSVHFSAETLDIFVTNCYTLINKPRRFTALTVCKKPSAEKIEKEFLLCLKARLRSSQAVRGE